MEKPERMTNISVIWRGTACAVELPSTATLKDLGIELQRLLRVRDYTIKLIVPLHSGKGSKLLNPFSDDHARLSLIEASIVEGKPVQVMGVPDDEMEAIFQGSKIDMRIAGFDEEDKRMKQKASRHSHSLRKLPDGPYIFCDFRTLDIPRIQLNPPPSEALKLMHKLAADPGIIAIMSKHHWRVGIMTEMAPVGYVGISPKCLLGFNKNHGEEISLRLRTDDLKGFRKYETIKKTLLHELAHMVYSEHDANFFALDKQLNHEANSLDWTKSNGRKLSANSKSYDDLEEYEEDEKNISNVPQILGGNSSNQLWNPSLSAAAAALYRLSNTSISKNSEESSDFRTNENEMDPSTTEKLVEISAESVPHFPEAREFIMESDPDTIQNEQSKSGISNPKEELVLDEHLSTIQDPVTALCTRLKEATKNLQTEGPSEQNSVLQTLLKIIRNLIDHPGEDKYKKLRKTNPVIHKQITNCKAAMNVLQIIGFIEDVEYLTLKRNDPGLLWLAKSTLESYKP